MQKVSVIISLTDNLSSQTVRLTNSNISSAFATLMFDVFAGVHANATAARAQEWHQQKTPY